MAPEPPRITSAPPSPSIVSAPEPPVIVFAAVEPISEIAAETPLASTLAKCVTTELPLTCEAALARFTFVATSSARVLAPEPPLMDASLP